MKSSETPRDKNLEKPAEQEPTIELSGSNRPLPEALPNAGCFGDGPCLPWPVREFDSALVNNAGVLVAVFDKAGRIVLFNQACEEATGYRQAEIAGRTLWDTLLPEDQAESAKREFGRLTSGEMVSPRTLRWIAKDGSHRTIEWSEICLLAGDGSIRHVIGTGADITDRKQVEELNTRLGRIVEDSLNEIYVFDSESLNFIQVNRGARENLGYSMEELRRLTPVDLKPQFSPEDFAEVTAPLYEGTQDHIVFQTVHQRKDGSTYDVEVRLQLSRTETPPVFFSIIQDITQRKRAERELIAAKQDAELANRSKSEFLANMSHELRTPLNAVIGFAELIENEAMGEIRNKDYTDYAGQIRHAGKHLLDLISDVLDVSRVEAGKLKLHEEDLDIADVIHSSVALTGRRANESEISVEVQVPESLHPLRADERRIKQVLINLLSNALKFTPEGGSVTIEAADHPRKGLTIQVHDTGIGMAPENIPKALARFGQIDSSIARNFGGTGLGLPLSKALIELHGGTLEVDSALGEGTSITLRFPVERMVLPQGEDRRHYGAQCKAG